MVLGYAKSLNYTFKGGQSLITTGVWWEGGRGRGDSFKIRQQKTFIKLIAATHLSIIAESLTIDQTPI